MISETILGLKEKFTVNITSINYTESPIRVEGVTNITQRTWCKCASSQVSSTTIASTLYSILVEGDFNHDYFARTSFTHKELKHEIYKAGYFLAAAKWVGINERAYRPDWNNSKCTVHQGQRPNLDHVLMLRDLIQLYVARYWGRDAIFIALYSVDPTRWENCIEALRARRGNTCSYFGYNTATAVPSLRGLLQVLASGVDRHGLLALLYAQGKVDLA